ncbi:MAG: hypothetical protein JST26_15765 [Bacteroidetes bacterium]|nr:hypothetical protein [Bacteroidota bacterium]
MKKSYIIAMIVLGTVLSSCIRKYTCSCNVHLAASGYYPVDKPSSEPIGHLTTKKQATKYCNQAAKQLRENTKLLYDDWVEVSSTCVVK